jgi:hypothetical protein
VIDSLYISSLWGGQLHPDLGGGIVLVPARTRLTSQGALTSIRAALKRHRIAATVSPDGDLRLAMPNFTLSLQHLVRINAAVQSSRSCSWPKQNIRIAIA